MVVPFWNGQATLPRLLDSLPPGLPVLIVDDLSDERLTLPDRPGVRVLRLEEKGFFAGAVNAGLKACQTDVLVLNQDLWLTSDRYLDRIAELRETYALCGDGVLEHPAWPNGYVQGTFMFMRRDAIDKVGLLNAEEFPLWGGTAEWQLRACRCGFKAHVSKEWRDWFGHEGRNGDGDGKRKLVPAKAGRQQYGSAITEALRRWPHLKHKFIHTPPAISVVVPCYNYARYLPDAIHSLIGGDTCLGRWEPPGQSFQSFEVVIVDDASVDNTWEVAQSLADPWQGISAIHLDQNKGTPGAINAGIRASHGRLLTILSADDMAELWHLEFLHAAANEHPDMVPYGDLRIFGHKDRGRELKLPEYDFGLVLEKNPMPAGIMFTRAAWQKVGGYPESMIYGREDWAFNIALGMHGYCGVHSGMSGYLYRREGQNRSLRTGNVHYGEKEGGGFSWRQIFRQQLEALYPALYAGDRPMGCCGGGSGKQAHVPAPRGPLPSAVIEDAGLARKVAAMTAPLAPGMEFLEYIGGNAGNSYWWGPATGTRYVFGGSRPIGQVYAADVKGLLDLRVKTRAQFKTWIPPFAAQAQLATQKPVSVPAEKAAQANPPAPDDLTTLKGVGEATAGKLATGGYATFLALARSAPEQVAKDAGVSVTAARKAVLASRQQLGLPPSNIGGMED